VVTIDEAEFVPYKDPKKEPSSATAKAGENQLDEEATKPKEKSSEPPKNFTIVRAKFGTGNDWADVTEQVRKLVKDSKLHLVLPREGSALPQLGFPDPAPNRLKQLVVVYSLNGKEQSVTVETGQELDLRKADNGLQRPPKKLNGQPIHSQEAVEGKAARSRFTQWSTEVIRSETLVCFRSLTR